MSNPHSASGQAAGYLYQCERALLHLLDGARYERDVTLFLEALDDVHLERDGRPFEVLQLKHHMGQGGSLTDGSTDLWRTLNVWMTLVPQLDPDDNPVFTILTTAQAPPESAAALLKQQGRDASVALERLRDEARTSRSTTTKEWRERFERLTPAEQQRLVHAVIVRDAEPRLGDLDQLLAARLSVAARPEHLTSFVESIKGWWYARCVGMLIGSDRGVTTSDLLGRIHDLRDQYHPENLPFDYDLGEATEAERSSYATRVFIRQLQFVAATNDLLAMAIDDYHRAYANKSRWLRLGLIDPGELDAYEERLVLEWRREWAFMMADRSDPEDEDARARAGRALWRTLSDSPSVRIRPRFEDQMLTRGSYHELADRAGEPGSRHVGWHPQFAERLRVLLEAASL
jgi:hypothetical protein